MNNLKILFFIVVLFCSSIKVFSQQVNTDSLILLVNNTSDESDKVKLLNEIGNQLRYTDIEEAYQYLLKSEKLALKLKDWEQLSESYVEQGIVWQKKRMKDSAEYYLNKSYQIADENNYFNVKFKCLISLGLHNYYKKNYRKADSLYKHALSLEEIITKKELSVMLYNDIAMLNKASGDYDLAMENYHKALIISNKIGETTASGIVYSNLGLLYERQEEHELALEYLFKSLKIRQNKMQLKGESIVLNNLGLVYEGMGQYEKAKSYYRKSLEIKKQLNHRSGIAKIYNNIGIIYKNLGILDSARINYDKSLEINIELRDWTIVSHTYRNIGILYRIKKDYTTSIIYFDKALEIAENDNDIQELVKIYKELYEIYNKMEDYKNAFNYSYKYKIVYDSIYNLKSRKYIEEVEGKYQNLKKEKENQALLSNNLIKDEQLKQQVIIEFFIIILTILILVVLVVVIKSKSKLQQINKLLSQKNIQIENKRNKLKSANKELIKLGLFKENMTNMLVHDLKNPLNSILNIDIFPDTDSMILFVKQAGFKMMNLVQNMLDVYKYESAEFQLNKSKNKIEDLIKEAIVDIGFSVNQKSLKIDFKKSDNYFVYSDAEITKRILVNILSNAVKFSPKKGQITVNTVITDNKKLKISIFNQGIGIPKENHKLIFERFGQAKQMSLDKFSSTGLGLTFCKMAVEAHNGEIGVISESKTGVEFWFTLPEITQESANNVENDITKNISLSDMQYLKPFIKELHSYEIYEVSAIKSILKKIDKKNENINNWKNDVENALYDGNSELFLKEILLID
ncbi:MAG: tetratricopeptide repeat protein [Bacteroidales bacterium]|nr:tetratricopeptide repeat protein [Bacteroidales bacterium]